ncbi:MAG: RNase adapter RapZ [Alphaproteobacteria bacterium]|nr:MAG: RNase adapter RapZ [Alphaproteobacteria bacterium]
MDHNAASGADWAGPEQERRTRVVLVTGLSGAGKSSALAALEDLGFEAVDNLPLALLRNLVSLRDDNPEHEPFHAIAVGIDTRTRAFRPQRFEEQLTKLRKRPDLDLTVVFLDSSNEVIARRFTETRRRHPMAVDRPVADGIQRERILMEPVRAHADYVFDTSDLTVHDLRRILSQTFAPTHVEQLVVTVQSFAYPRGLPRDADIIYDVRFLRNPHYVEELRPLAGVDQPVADYIAADPSFHRFYGLLSDMLISLLPLYKGEGKAYLTIAFGCTGGRHRSVFVAEAVAKLLTEEGFRVNLLHRELERIREIEQRGRGE